MFKPEGVYVAMLTPFDDEGSINEAELRRIVDFQIKGGVDGLFPISSVGEFIHMSREEKFRMMEIIVDQNEGRIHITPGVGSSNPAESICLAQKAKDLGCDGVVVAPPCLPCPSPWDLNWLWKCEDSKWGRRNNPCRMPNGSIIAT